MKQITIITENRLGIVTEITEALAAAEVNIETIDAELADNYVVVVLTVDNYDNALAVMHRFKTMNVISEDAILVKLLDEPGALAKIAHRITDAVIGMRSIRSIQRNFGA